MSLADRVQWHVGDVEVLKRQRFNTHHGEGGKFTTGDGAAKTVADFTPLPHVSVYTPEGKMALAHWQEQNGPKAEAYATLMSDWTNAGSGVMSREAVDGSTAEGRQLASFMNEAPTIDGPIYRGASAVQLEPGFTFQLGPSSFTRDESTGAQYATRTSHPTVIEVDDARGLPVDGLSKYPEEREVISGGSFTVVSSTMESVPTYGDPMQVQHVVVTQAPTTAVRMVDSWWKPTRPLTPLEQELTGTFADARPRIRSGKRAQPKTDPDNELVVAAFIHVFGLQPQPLRFNQNHDAGGRFTTGDAVAETDLNTLAAGRPVDISATSVGALLKTETREGRNVNLNNLGVQGTYIFRGTTDIPREDMPQIPDNQRDAFVADLKASGVATHEETLAVTALKPTQSEINGAKATGIASAIRDGKFNPDSQPIFATRDGDILDGHHRWAGEVVNQYLTGVPQSMKVDVIDAPLQRVLDFANTWDTEHGVAHAGFATGPADVTKGF